MKTLFAFLVAVLLPLQLSWGVAASYCQHEATRGGFNHFGHHSHDHAPAQAETSVLSQAESQTPGAKLMTDMDCGVCHASLLAMVADASDLAPDAVMVTAPLLPGDPFASALQRTPDRPQWPRLV